MAENEEAKFAQLEVDQLVLTRDRMTGAVAITGNVKDIDMTLDMLSRATRYFDVQYRIGASIQAQEQINERKKEFERVQRLLGKM